MKAKPAQEEPGKLSAAERQEAFRRRRAEAGLSEVRGIFLPAELHAEIKKAARRLLRSSQRRAAAEQLDHAATDEPATAEQRTAEQGTAELGGAAQPIRTRKKPGTTRKKPGTSTHS